jgi:hypothetical protein
MRILRFTLAALALGTLPALADDEDEKFAIPPRTVKLDMANSTLGKVGPAVARSAGIPFTFPADAAGQTADGIYNQKPFWFALEMLASQTGNRIVVSENGKKIALEPRGKAYEVSSVHGAFRTVARQVVGRVQLDTGVTVHEVQLDLHWEPRFPVFRVDSSPKVGKITDEKGTALAVSASGGRSQTTGYLHPATVRVTGITRDMRRIGTLDGNFTITASEKMLTFEWDDLAKGATAVKLPAKDQVTATLKRVNKDEATWEYELDLAYPPNLPKFESFESWTHENRARLVSPDKTKSFTTDDFEILTQGSKITATYRFKEDSKRGLVNPAAKGWKLVYETPSPPLEFTVPFQLKDLPLP